MRQRPIPASPILALPLLLALAACGGSSPGPGGAPAPCAAPGAAAALAIGAQPPASVQAGAAFAFRVTVRDAGGCEVADGAATVSLALTGGAGGATLAGATATTTAGGAAAWAGLSVDVAGNGYALTASVPGLAPVTSTAFAVTAGPPSALRSTLAAGSAAAPADGTAVELLLTPRDALGNLTAIGPVTFGASDAAVGLVQAADLPARPDGLVPGRASALAPGEVTLRASYQGTVLAEQVVRFTPARPDPLLSTVEVAPASVPADGTSAATVTVVLLDRLGRPVAGEPVSLAYGGAASLAPALATSDAAGAAVFSATASAATTGALTATASPGPEAVLLAAAVPLEFTEVRPGPAWSDPHRLAAAADGFDPDSGFALAAAPDGRAVAAWIQRLPDPDWGTAPRVHAAVRGADGAWGPAAALQGGAAGFAFDPVAGIDAAGDAWVAWIDWVPLARAQQVRAARYDAQAGGWSAAVPLEPASALDSIFVRLSVAGDGSAVAAWTRESEAVPDRPVDLLAATYRPGTGWSAPVLLDADEQVGEFRPRALGAGRAVVAWHGRSGGPLAARASRLAPPGGWARHDFGAPAEANLYAMDASPTGQAWVALQDAAPVPAGSPVVMIGGAADGTWGLPVGLDLAGASTAYQLQVQVDAAGDGVALWGELVGGVAFRLRAASAASGWAGPDLVAEAASSDWKLAGDGASAMACAWISPAAAGAPQLAHVRWRQGGAWGTELPGLAVGAASPVLAGLALDRAGLAHLTWIDAAGLWVASGGPAPGP